MNRFTALLTVLLASLACAGSSTYSDEAQEQCAAAPDANDCDKCYAAACGTQCMECIDDETCNQCTDPDGGADQDTCMKNEQVALLLTCVLGADCAAQCAGEAPPDPGRPPHMGHGRRGKGGKAKSPRPGDDDDAAGGGEGKTGKQGKRKAGG